MNENFKRRERCADVIAQMKASSVAVFWAHRDWVFHVHAAGDAHHHHQRHRPALPLPPPRPSQADTDGEVPAAPPPAPPLNGHAQNALDVLREFLANVRGYIITGDDKPERVEAYYTRALRSLSTLHVLNEMLGDAAGYARACEGGISRLAQNTRMMLAQLEQLKILRCYSGSPQGLRFFVTLMTHLSPIGLAPYFRNFCSKYDASERTRLLEDYATSAAGHTIVHRGAWGAHDQCAPGYFASALYCAVVCTLYAVMCDIEDLYDGRGLDDVHFNLVRAPRHRSMRAACARALRARVFCVACHDCCTTLSRPRDVQDVELDEAAAAVPFPAAPLARRGDGGDASMAVVRFVYDDCLGPRHTALAAAAEDAPPRVFAHRNPSKRMSWSGAARVSTSNGAAGGGGGYCNGNGGVLLTAAAADVDAFAAVL